MADRVEGQVAQVLNERELVINRGSSHGVEEGMRFAVLNRQGAHITDPETGESLGAVEVEKTLVKVVRVSDKLSVGRTFRTFRRGGFSPPDALQSLLAPARTEVETLRTEGKTYVEELDEAESYVKRGDPVVQIVGEEFETQ